MLRAFKGQSPRVDATAYVDQSAQVIGDVEIGAESSVWMNVVIRGDVNAIRIGRRTNIQDLTMVHVMRGTHPTVHRRRGDGGPFGGHPRLHDRGSRAGGHGRRAVERRPCRSRTA